jgi:hypothetical protein
MQPSTPGSACSACSAFAASVRSAIAARGLALALLDGEQRLEFYRRQGIGENELLQRNRDALEPLQARGVGEILEGESALLKVVEDVRRVIHRIGHRFAGEEFF